MAKNPALLLEAVPSSFDHPSMVSSNPNESYNNLADITGGKYKKKQYL